MTKWDTISIINLEARVDRKEQSIELCKKFDLDAAFIRAVSALDLMYREDLNPRQKAELGCKLSHLKCIENAKSNNSNCLLILEDDFLPLEGFSSRIEDVLSNLPDDWDMFYLGGHHSIPPVHLFSGIGRAIATSTTHAYMVNMKAYNFLINYIRSNDKQIDLIYRDLQWTMALNIYCSIPDLVTQRPSYSDIVFQDVDYSLL